QRDGSGPSRRSRHWPAKTRVISANAVAPSNVRSSLFHHSSSPLSAHGAATCTRPVEFRGDSGQLRTGAGGALDLEPSLARAGGQCSGTTGPIIGGQQKPRFPHTRSSYGWP